MQIYWSPLAEDDLVAIFDFISQDDLQAAIKMDNLFRDAAEKLQYFPYKGRVGRCLGTREFVVHTNYILVYQIKGNMIQILNILHTAKRYPPE